MARDLSKFGTKEAKGTAVIKRKDGSTVYLQNGRIVSQKDKSGRSLVNINVQPSTKSSGIIASSTIKNQKQLNVSRKIAGVQNKVNRDMRNEPNKARVIGTTNRRGTKLTSVSLQIRKVTPPKPAIDYSKYKRGTKPSATERIISQIVGSRTSSSKPKKNSFVSSVSKKKSFSKKR